MWRSYLLVLSLLLPACVGTMVPVNQPASTKQLPSTYFDSIYVEVAYVGSQRPASSVIDHFRNEILRYRIAKECRVMLHSVEYTIYGPWNTGLLNTFETGSRIYRDQSPKDRRLRLFVAYLPGTFIEGTYNNIAGIAYGTSAFAIFCDTISDISEGNVFFHELCHLLEFVDVGARNQTPVKPDRPHHCNNEQCVMFWRASRQRTTLDGDCVLQLADKITKHRSGRATVIGPLSQSDE